MRQNGTHSKLTSHRDLSHSRCISADLQEQAREEARRRGWPTGIGESQREPLYLVSLRARTAAPVIPALSPSFEAIISTPFNAPGMA